MKELKDKMDQIKFSDNVEERMLRAMKEANSNEQISKTKVSEKIRSYRLRTAKLAVAAAACLVLVFSNQNIQAAIGEFMNIFKFSTENATQQNVSIKNGDYKLNVYSVAQSEHEIVIEMDLRNQAGETVTDKFTPVGYNNDDTVEISGAQGIMQKVKNNRTLLIVTAEADVEKDYSYLVGKKQYATLSFRDIEAYRVDGEEKVMDFTFAFTIDKIAKSTEYKMKNDGVAFTYNGIDVRITKIIDTGIFIKCEYEYDQEEAEKKNIPYITFSAKCGDEQLLELGGSDNIMMFDKEGFDMENFSVSPVVLELFEDGSAECTDKNEYSHVELVECEANYSNKY